MEAMEVLQMVEVTASVEMEIFMEIKILQMAETQMVVMEDMLGWIVALMEEKVETAVMRTVVLHQ